MLKKPKIPQSLQEYRPPTSEAEQNAYMNDFMRRVAHNGQETPPMMPASPADDPAQKVKLRDMLAGLDAHSQKKVKARGKSVK